MRCANCDIKLGGDSLRLLTETSCLKAAGYDYETETLYVQFTSGKTYEYYNVPKNIYNEMMTTLSRGNYLATKIANAYNYSEVQEV